MYKRKHHTKIKAIIFDLGGVLIDNPTKQMFDYYSNALQVTKEAFLLAFLKFKDEWQTGNISEAMFWNNIAFELNAIIPENDSLWLKGFTGAYKEKKEMFELLRLLKEKHYKLAVLSNIEFPIKEYIANKRYQNIDLFIFSCDVGMAKPDKEIYQLVLEKLQVKPSEAIFIDDRMDNVEGAQQKGMHGLVFTDSLSLYKHLSKLHLL